MEIYVVKQGDTINSIADEFGVSPQRLAQDNAVIGGDRLVVGQALVIQIPEIVHIAQIGETLYTVAVNYDTTVNVLLQNNPYLIGKNLRAGDEIVVRYVGDKRGVIRTNGYAYTFINKKIFESVLPYMTSVTIFGYGFDTQGNLEEPDDEDIIRLCYAYSARPIMLISAMQNGVFNTELASIIFNNIEVQEVLIENVLEVMREKGYLGLDVDFEFIEPDDALVYQNFLRNITERLNAEGFTVNVDLAPKISASQQGLLYEAHDYFALGEIADTVLLMTYEWGYQYSQPMSVAPIPSIMRVLDYAVTEIDRDKIYMGIPNYAYDWKIPYVEGTAATVIGNDEAVRIAWANGAEIQFDELAQTPYFNYTDENGQEHEVWFEDARSIFAKLELIDEYGFIGAGYWNIMRAFSQNWLVLSSLFDIAKLI